MKLFLCLMVLVAGSLAAVGPRCWDKCTIITEFSQNGNSEMSTVEAKWKKCQDDTIKYCAVGQTCNNFDSTAKGTVKIGASPVPVPGNMKMTYWYCGYNADDITKAVCDGIGKEIQASFDKMDAAAVGYSVTDIKATCDANAKSCDGKSKECIDMSLNPDYPDNKKMSDGTVPKMCTLLLAYPFLALMM